MAALPLPFISEVATTPYSVGIKIQFNDNDICLWQGVDTPPFRLLRGVDASHNVHCNALLMLQLGVAV
jgi:hypothetical protein